MQLADKVKKLAGKTHKDRVHEFNSKLETLSEHHDIPKVSVVQLAGAPCDQWVVRLALDKVVLVVLDNNGDVYGIPCVVAYLWQILELDDEM
jgi:hypothetical protein